jgi:Trypsin-co-occurring domain 1
MSSDSVPGEAEPPFGQYEVAVAIAPTAWVYPGPSFSAAGDADADAGPGFDETSGFRQHGRHAAQVVLAKGDAVVKLATESIARQIGLAAQRIASTIETQGLPASTPGTLALDSVEVTFGVTLTAGVEALFTATEESSVQVTIVLSRRQ